MARAQLWTRDFVLGIGLNLTMSMVFYLLMTSMAGYAVTRFAAGDAASGFASSSFIVGAVLSRILAGKYLDFVGRRKMLIYSMAASVLACVAYIYSDTMPALITVRIVHGITFGAGNTAIMTAIQSVIPSHRRGEGTGYFGTATTISTALGPYLGVILPQEFEFWVLFAASALVSVSALVLALLIRLPEQELSASQIADKWRLRLNTLVDVDGLRIGMIMLITGTAYAAALVFLAGYAADVGVPEAASLFFVAYAIASLVARLFVGRMQDVFGDNIVIYPVLVLNLVGNLMLAWWPTTSGIVLAGVVIGLGFGSLMPSAQAMLIKTVSMARVPVATSSFFLLLDAGSGVGPIILGALMPVTGGSGMFLLCAGLVLAAMVVYFFAHGRHRGGRPGREFIG